jgi:excinuclease ABC subunit A
MKRIEKFATEEICRTCNGGRIKKEYLAVRISGKNIAELTRMSVRESLSFFDVLRLSKEEEKISGLVLKNIRDRLQFLQ